MTRERNTVCFFYLYIVRQVIVCFFFFIICSIYQRKHWSNKIINVDTVPTVVAFLQYYCTKVWMEMFFMIFIAVFNLKPFNFFTAKDFIVHLMKKNSNERFTCDQALQHPWYVSFVMSSLQHKPFKWKVYLKIQIIVYFVFLLKGSFMITF